MQVVTEEVHKERQTISAKLSLFKKSTSFTTLQERFATVRPVMTFYLSENTPSAPCTLCKSDTFNAVEVGERAPDERVKC